MKVDRQADEKGQEAGNAQNGEPEARVSSLWVFVGLLAAIIALIVLPFLWDILRGWPRS